MVDPIQVFIDCWVKKLDINANSDIVFDSLKRAWKYPEFAQKRDGLWIFATGGWADNEAIINALCESMFGMIVLRDRIWLPGGLFVFAVTDEARKQLHEVMDVITEWAWHGGKLKRDKDN